MAADARLPGSWLGDPKYDQLSDAEWRVFTGALMYTMLHLTDGKIPDYALRLLHPDGPRRDVVERLVELKLLKWKPGAEPHWLVADFTKSQSTREQVEKYRESNRLRQERFRANHPLTEPDNPSRNALPNARGNSVSRQGKAKASLEGDNNVSGLGSRDVRANDEAMDRLKAVSS